MTEQIMQLSLNGEETTLFVHSWWADEANKIAVHQVRDHTTGINNSVPMNAKDIVQWIKNTGHELIPGTLGNA